MTRRETVPEVGSVEFGSGLQGKGERHFVSGGMNGDAGVVAGIDGCCGGWVVAVGRSGALGRWGVIGAIGDLPAFLGNPGCATIWIDIPIGLAPAANPVRSCDLGARRRLRGRRSSSVFAPPLREVLRVEDYAEANALQKRLCDKGLSKQVFGIMPKIREVDHWIGRDLPAGWEVRESHPELVFEALAGRPLERKASAVGILQRFRVIQERLGSLAEPENPPPPGASPKIDDILDAAGLLAGVMVAAREGTVRIGGECDPVGLPMEIVYPESGYDFEYDQ